MALVIKRRPIDPTWVERTECKGKDPGLWDLDTAIWRRGRRICVHDCTVREDCLRSAFQSEGGTIGVVAGGHEFDLDQMRKKKSQCLICGYFVAPLKLNEEKKPVQSICWVCRRFALCLNQCGRMVTRKPGLDSYYCKHCAK